MDVLKIRGGNRLEGTVTVDGAKNAVLPVMAASLMVKGDVLLENVPDLSDVRSMLTLLEKLGVTVKREKKSLVINSDHAVYCDLPEEMMKTMRASNLLWGPLLDRFSMGRIPLPGGCRIGSRPMDLHIRGMRALGVEVDEEGGVLMSFGEKRKGTEICLDFPSVGATENIVMAAVRAKGKTVIRNAAREPEVADLCRFLNACGGKIGGIGGDTLEILGVERLTGTAYTVIPDRVVCGTVLPAVMMCGGDVTLDGVCPDHLGALIGKIQDCGGEIFLEEHRIRIRGKGEYRSADLSTMPYPGFPTDMQPQFMAAMTTARGVSVIKESIFENRFTQACEMLKMGADIRVEDRVAVVRGREGLRGAKVRATDLRCGASLIMAALKAKGESTVFGVEYIDRGYAEAENLFSSLGAEIKRETI